MSHYLAMKHCNTDMPFCYCERSEEFVFFRILLQFVFELLLKYNDFVKILMIASERFLFEKLIDGPVKINLISKTFDLCWHSLVVFFNCLQGLVIW